MRDVDRKEKYSGKYRKKFTQQKINVQTMKMMILNEIVVQTRKRSGWHYTNFNFPFEFHFQSNRKTQVHSKLSLDQKIFWIWILSFFRISEFISLCRYLFKLYFWSFILNFFFVFFFLYLLLIPKINRIKEKSKRTTVNFLIRNQILNQIFELFFNTTRNYKDFWKLSNKLWTFKVKEKLLKSQILMILPHFTSLQTLISYFIIS